MAEREKKKKSNFFTYNNNIGVPSMNRQNKYSIQENSDWEIRNERYKGKYF